MTFLGPAWALTFSLVVLAIGLTLAIVAYRALGHVICGEYLVFRSGALPRTTAVMRRDAVIGWQFKQSILQRRLGLMTVTAVTAAGVGSYSATDMAANEAVAFANEATPGMLTTFIKANPRHQ